MTPEYIKDKDCTKDTPVTLGKPECPIFGTGQRIKPRVDGKQETEYDKKIHLPELLPLEEYDMIVVLFSGGKDSAAAFWKLIELGVPKSKIELWHHDIDGGNPDRTMDWPVTQAYVKAFADWVGCKLRVSWRVNGFFGELYRVGASYPVEYEHNGKIKTCQLTKNQKLSEELREQILKGSATEDELKQYGYRFKFPAKSGSLARRWCSAYLKIDVASSVLRNLEELRGLGSERHKFPAKSGAHQGRWCSGALKAQVQSAVTSDMEETKQNAKILIVSGERRGESAGRAKYNEMGIHRTNATAKAHRLVHQWRAVIDCSERDVWEILKRHGTTPHPCYTAGWNRCSCMMCIFSMPKHWSGIRELFPEQYEAMKQDEERLGFTIDNKKTLDEYTGEAESCVSHKSEKALEQIRAGHFTIQDIYTDPERWEFPAGAFKGSEGGPC